MARFWSSQKVHPIRETQAHKILQVSFSLDVMGRQGRLLNFHGRKWEDARQKLTTSLGSREAGILQAGAASMQFYSSIHVCCARAALLLSLVLTPHSRNPLQ